MFVAFIARKRLWMNYLVFICMTVGLVAATNSEKEKDTLVLLHVVARHGDRTPGTYPNDPHADFDYYPVGPAALTEDGIQRAYEIGRRIRRRYSDLLGSRYYYKSIEVLSSSVPRCRRTVQGILAEMYPSVREDATCIVGQLIDFDYVDPAQDRLLAPFLTCPQMIDVNFTVLDRLCDGFEEVRAVLRQHSGFQITKPLEVFLVHDTLKGQKEHGLRLPDWAHSIYPEPLATCSRDMFQAVVEDKKVLRHIAGNLMRKIVQDTTKKVQGDADHVDKKVYLYSSHDQVLVGLLGILGLYNRQDISYGSHIMFEVHRIEDVVGLRIYHDNFDKEGPRLLDVPNCGTFCPLETFANLTSLHFPTVWCDF